MNALTSWLGQVLTLKSTKFWGAYYGVDNDSGQSVTPQRAMQLSAVWRAIRLTAETLAAMPRGVFQETPSGPLRVTGSPTDVVIRQTPNQEQTAFEFWEQMVGCMELVGDGLAQKHFIGKRLTAMTVMSPVNTEVRRLVSGGLEYRTKDWRGREIVLAPDEVFHMKGFSLGGERGMSTVSFGAQTMGLALAAQKTQARLFKSGLRNSGFLNTGQVLEEPDRERLQAIMGEYMGAENAGGMMILEGGMTFTPMTMSAQDAELLLTRKFEIEEIGRWFGMPPILLGHAVEGQTMWGSGVEAIILSWLTLGLQQRVKRIEDAIGKRVMSSAERAEKLYTKFNLDSLLRADSLARAQLMSAYAQNGLRTRNELRALDEQAAMAGGDELTVQSNLVPLTTLGDISAPEAQARDALRSWLFPESKDGHPPSPAPAPPLGG